MIPLLEASESGAPGSEAGDAEAGRDVGAWIGQLLRTLKTSRLYDAANPTVVRFREELADALRALLERRGAVRLAVGPRSLQYAGHEVQPGRPGDENLAGVLHRDGIRTLRLEPGIPPREVDALVDQLLEVTRPSAGDDDLVTLLWNADLAHVAIETVPLDGEADGGGEEGGEATAGPVWPRQGGARRVGTSTVRSPETRPGAGGDPALDGGDGSRSDDWTTAEGPADLEHVFDDLESGALAEIARFQSEGAEEAARSIPSHAVRVLQDCFASELTAADRAELAEFIARLLRETIGIGDWGSAAIALSMLRTCDPDWEAESFCRELSGPLAITTRRAVRSLDGQDQEGVATFLALAERLGPAAATWLMHVIAESE